MPIENPLKFYSNIKNTYFYTAQQLTLFYSYHQRLYLNLLDKLREYNEKTPQVMVSNEVLDLQILRSYFGSKNKRKFDSERLVLLKNDIIEYAQQCVNCQNFWTRLPTLLSDLKQYCAQRVEGPMFLQTLDSISFQNCYVYLFKDDLSRVKLCVSPNTLSNDQLKKEFLVLPFTFYLWSIDYFNSPEIYLQRVVQLVSSKK